MPKFPLTSALLSGSASAHEVDEIAWLLTGGPGNRTAYMAGAAKRAAKRVETVSRMREWVPPSAPRKPMTDANYPLDCGSRFD